jgi:hypothetical protein
MRQRCGPLPRIRKIKKNSGADVSEFSLIFEIRQILFQL